MVKKKIVLVGGVFDILHFGHITFLKKAKKLGDYLVVAIESDNRVKKIKGDTRPFHNQEQRKEILESLNFVDEVIILKDNMTETDYFDLVDKVRPCQIAVTKGDPMLEKKRQQAEKIDAKVIEIPFKKGFSTSAIAKKLELE